MSLNSTPTATPLQTPRVSDESNSQSLLETAVIFFNTCLFAALKKALLKLQHGAELCEMLHSATQLIDIECARKDPSVVDKRARELIKKIDYMQDVVISELRAEKTDKLDELDKQRKKTIVTWTETFNAKRKALVERQSACAKDIDDSVSYMKLAGKIRRRPYDLDRTFLLRVVTLESAESAASELLDKQSKLYDDLHRQIVELDSAYSDESDKILASHKTARRRIQTDNENLKKYFLELFNDMRGHLQEISHLISN